MCISWAECRFFLQLRKNPSRDVEKHLCKPDVTMICYRSTNWSWDIRSTTLEKRVSYTEVLKNKLYGSANTKHTSYYLKTVLALVIHVPKSGKRRQPFNQKYLNQSNELFEKKLAVLFLFPEFSTVKHG